MNRSSLSLVLLVLSLVSAQCNAGVILGKVVGISDGDTIKVLDSALNEYKIRLAGIDAPEKTQPFGEVSKRSLSSMLYGKQVHVEWSKEDKYKRIVGKVLINGADANLMQINRGLAWHYKMYSNEQSPSDAAEYAIAENAARNEGLGLWSDASAIAPWDWRKQKKTRADTLP